MYETIDEDEDEDEDDAVRRPENVEMEANDAGNKNKILIELE